MSLTYQELTELLTHVGVISRDDLTLMVNQISPDSTCPDISLVTNQLLRYGKITAYQQQLLLEGRSLEMGNYLILDSIGQGGMGLVYKARHQQMDRVVALKVIHNKSSLAANERFQREIKVVASIKHPNVVAAYDAGDVDGVQYLVMEYISGLNLSQYVVKNGPLPVSLAVGYLRQVAEGLKCIHDLGIVHRDIKPSNLLLENTGTVKILDLGLSRLIEWPSDSEAETLTELTAPGQIVGTVDYMAPEQFTTPKSLDHRADFYSLGCTFYFLLAGKPPFLGRTMGEKVVAHREQRPPLLRQVRDSVSPELEALFQRLIAKHPEQRLASADELIAALDALPGHHSATTVISAVDNDQSARPPVTVASKPRDPSIALKMGALSGVLVLVVLAMAIIFTRPKADQAAVANPDGPVTQPAPKLVSNPQPAAVPGRVVSAAVPAVVANVNDLHRVAADLVLDRGGTVDVIAGGKYLPTISVAAKLPSEFEIFRVNLSGSSVTDADLSVLEPLTTLVLVDVARTKITDKGLRSIARLTGLTAFNAGETEISDDGLKLLDGLRDLKTLDLRGTRVTDAGLEHLARTHSLTSLMLGENQVTTDAGLQHLTQMQSLSSLGLRASAVTDDGLVSLGMLKNLKWIDLGLTGVSDKGVENLERLNRIEQVILNGTKVTKEGIRKLETKCTVSL
ncbi:MAG: serine/threonine protein kinase [Planctomycetaceae bacterium]|nr:serine/threonine protein kinase [Planctomycetaceae bacterium]